MDKYLSLVRTHIQKIGDATSIRQKEVTFSEFWSFVKRTGKKLVPALLVLASQESDAVSGFGRYFAADALALIGPAANAAIRPLSNARKNDRDKNFRKFAALALRKICPSTKLRIPKRLLGQEEIPPSEVFYFAVTQSIDNILEAMVAQGKLEIQGQGASAEYRLSPCRIKRKTQIVKRNNLSILAQLMSPPTSPVYRER